MTKKIKHMGMEMSEEEHERWHKEHTDLTPEEHKALMEKMGVGEEEDRKWHEKYGMPQVQSGNKDQKPVNPFAIGGAFLDYCVSRGWLVREGKGRDAKYYVTDEGKVELARFGIKF